MGTSLSDERQRPAPHLHSRRPAATSTSGTSIPPTISMSGASKNQAVPGAPAVPPTSIPTHRRSGRAANRTATMASQAGRGSLRSPKPPTQAAASPCGREGVSGQPWRRTTCSSRSSRVTGGTYSRTLRRRHQWPHGPGRGLRPPTPPVPLLPQPVTAVHPSEQLASRTGASGMRSAHVLGSLVKS